MTRSKNYRHTITSAGMRRRKALRKREQEDESKVVYVLPDEFDS